MTVPCIKCGQQVSAEYLPNPMCLTCAVKAISAAIWPAREEAPPRWSEHPPGVLRASGWYMRNLIEALCAQAQKGRVPVERKP